EMWSLKASYTEMNQFAHRLTTTFIDLPSAVWMPSTADIEPMLSRQVALGTNVALPHNISIEVEGFYKTMEHIREYKGYRLFPPIQNWEHTYVEGRGRAYGMETSVVYNTVKTHAAVNYTLSWSERFFEDIFPTWFPDRLDNRHRLNLSVSHRFTDRFEMYLGWNWHSGDRITTESQSSSSSGLRYYTGPNNATLPDYHRLDVGFNFHKTTRRGNEAIWNLSIYNVYCRMNAMVVWALRDRYEAVGLVPILPTFSYTLKFRK
ncbi:MAG: TonB-dependent receptor, partial [Bacteroidales bacterium]|nr:TonB-dependent receptor [Bacteroidales bacterium]